MAKIGEKERQSAMMRAARAEMREKRATMAKPKTGPKPAPTEDCALELRCKLCEANPSEVAYALEFLAKHRARSRAGMKKYRKAPK